MSPKKIDPKKIVSQIFGPSPKVARNVEEERLFSLVGRERKKRFSLQQLLSGRFLWQTWKNEFAGIDLGSDSIKFVLLAKDQNRLHLKDVQIEKLVRDEEEKGVEGQARQFLDGLIKIASRIKPKTKAGIAINDPSLYMDLITIPSGTDEELRESIRKELAEQHLIDPKTSFFDYVPANGSDDASRVQSILVVAAPQDLVYRRLETVQGAGFKVLSVEANTLASLFAVRRVARWEQKDRILVLDIGARYSGLSVVVGDRFVLSRIVPVAGERFTVAISEVIGCDFRKAEELKCRYGLTGQSISGTPVESGSDLKSEAEVVAQTLAVEVEKLLAEVERSFQFAFSKETGEEGTRIKNIFLLGGSSRMPLLKEYISTRLEAPVRDVDLWEGLVVDHRMIERSFLDQSRDLVATSLGLALRVTEWKTLPFGWGMPG